jgi:hypothetical protein
MWLSTSSQASVPARVEQGNPKTSLVCVLLPAGKLFHSGLPHKAVNPIELAMDAVGEIQRRFYQDFAPHPEEAR